VERELLGHMSRHRWPTGRRHDPDRFVVGDDAHGESRCGRVGTARGCVHRQVEEQMQNWTTVA
jgi:hypothetical protein